MGKLIGGSRLIDGLPGRAISHLHREPLHVVLPRHWGAWSLHRLQLTTLYSLVTTHYSALTTHYSLLTTHYSLLTTYLPRHWGAWSFHCLQLTTHYSLVTTHYSALGTHYSLLTTYYLLLTCHGIGERDRSTATWTQCSIVSAAIRSPTCSGDPTSKWDPW